MHRPGSVQLARVILQPFSLLKTNNCLPEKMYSLVSFRSKVSNRSRSRHRLAPETGGHSGNGRQPRSNSVRNVGCRFPFRFIWFYTRCSQFIQAVGPVHEASHTNTGHVNSPEDIIAFHKFRIPVRCIFSSITFHSADEHGLAQHPRKGLGSSHSSITKAGSTVC